MSKIEITAHNTPQPCGGQHLRIPTALSRAVQSLCAVVPNDHPCNTTVVGGTVNCAMLTSHHSHECRDREDIVMIVQANSVVGKKATCIILQTLLHHCH